MCEVTETRALCQAPFLSPRLMTLFYQHRDLTRLRLAISRQIETVEREMQIVEQTQHHAASPGVAPCSAELNPGPWPDLGGPG